MIIWNGDTTNDAINFVKNNMELIGEVILVEHDSKRLLDDYVTIIEGTKDTLKIIGGLGSGFQGEGPRGLAQVLKELGYPEGQSDRCAQSKTGFKQIL